MGWQDRITINPDILVDKPVVSGTRLAVEFIAELLANERTETDILENHPGLPRRDIRACLADASGALKSEKVYSLAVAGQRCLT
jgi:uncharacterized protein (DUF433 family)